MITNCILNDEYRILTVSNYAELSDTYNGYPVVLGRNGVVRRLGLQISPDEQIKFNSSIRALQQAIKEVTD